MKISLVTTVRNEASSIDDLIAAVAAQSRRPDQWVVVDGGSSDDTVDRLRLSSARVVIEPGNIAHGRNRAVAEADGELIAVVDAGCRPRRDWLANLVQPIENGRSAVAAGVTVPRIATWFDAVQWVLLDQFVGTRWVPRRPALSSRSLAFRRDTWIDCPYPEWLDLGEDTWLLEEWQRRGHSIERVDSAVVEWRLRERWREFLAQHFGYMRGDGRAGLHPRRHGARFAFYGLLGTAIAFGNGTTAWMAGAGWLLYLAATATRVGQATAGHGASFTLRVSAALAPCLLAMDLAKMSGYAVGRVDRWRRRCRESG
jgi:glycosyltransferase involved in cell wall biosynthesis